MAGLKAADDVTNAGLLTAPYVRKAGPPPPPPEAAGSGMDRGTYLLDEGCCWLYGGTWCGCVLECTK